MNKSFISRIRDKVLGAFSKPIVNEKSIKRFIPLLVHVFKSKHELESQISNLKESHKILFEILNEYVGDELAKNLSLIHI